MINETRLNKAMSILGICSRRDGDRFIADGKVSVNGKVVSATGSRVLENDKISFDGQDYVFTNDVKRKAWIYYKPAGLVTSHNDENDRETVFDDLKDKIKERVISVGRLDLNSEGLLVLTNSGKFSQFAESPKTGWERHYKVRIFGELTSEIISQLEAGVTIDEISYAPLKITSINQGEGSNSWIECVLTEGKNREIRKLFEHFGILVNRLIRFKYGPYELGDLQPGDVRLVDMIEKREISDEDIQIRNKKKSKPTSGGFRSRGEGNGDRPSFRPRSESGDRRERPASGGFRPRGEGGDRSSFRPRSESGDRRERPASGSFRPRGEGGDRPSFRPRGEGNGDRPRFRPRAESGDRRDNRNFKKRD